MKRTLIAVFLMLALAGSSGAQNSGGQSVSANLTTQGTSTGFTTTSGLCYQLTSNQGAVAIQLAGTWSGTVSFYASISGQPLAALNATPSNSSTAASTSTSNGLWQANAGAYGQICAIVTTYSSGTVVVTIQSSPASARSGGSSSGGSGLTVGTTTIASGTNGSLLYNNSGLLGNETLASLLVAPGPIGSTTASTGAFTTLSASSTVSGTGFSTYLASPPAIGGSAAAAGSFTTLTGTLFASTTNCAAAGSAASPSLVACSAAPTGSFSCATNASTATCVISTTAVTANSRIFVQPSAAEGSNLSVTCNTTADTGLTAPRLAGKSAGTSFTINLGTFSTNPVCFNYWISD